MMNRMYRSSRKFHSKALRLAVAGALGYSLVLGGVAFATDNTAGSGNGVAVGNGSSAPKAENVAIGKGAGISYSNGASDATGDIAVGNGANINNYASQGGSIAIGNNAKIENMAGGAEASFAFGQTTYSGDRWSTSRIPADPTKVVGSIAIGDNTFARTGSTMIGSHNYKGELGDTTVDSSSTRTYALNVYSTTLGANSFSNGAFTTSTGAYNIISSSYNGGRRANPVQNLGATINGSLNSIESMNGGYYSGIANTITGIANRTANSNGALIYGAGNEITNSITSLTSVPSDSGKSAKDFADKLRTAISSAKGGGATLAIGGGNTADWTQASQLIGVNNTLKGTKDSVSKYNLVDGFENTLTNSNNTYVIGTKNNFVNMANSIIVGDNNRRLANDESRIMKDTIVLGDGNTVQNGDESIAIGKNINIKRDGGNNYEYDTGNVAIGSNAYISSYVNQGDSIAIGKNSTVLNMNGSLEKAFAFGTPEGKDYSGSIAIGENSYARSGSTMIGIHNYQGKLGDLDINFTSGKSEGSSGIGGYQESINATTIGNNSYNNGTFSTVLGSYSAVSGLYHDQKWDEKPYGVQNFGAAVVGSLNSVESKTSEEHNTAGMADSILGSANRTKNANGTVMVGAGNVVTNSINDFDASGIKTKDGISDPNALSEAMRTAIKAQNGGGAAAVVGNGNIVDNATNVSIFGSKNSLKNTTKAQLLGDNRIVDKADNSVIVGSADPELTTSNKNVTVLGYNANATVDGGVALGSESQVVDNDKSSEARNEYGYDYAKHDTTDPNYAWQSNLTSVSVGSSGHTRRITNVAAGIDLTDAVNVAQLKAAMGNAGSNINLVAGDGIKIDTNNGTYTISANITGDKTATDTTTVTPKGSNSDTSGGPASTDKGNTDTTGNGKQLIVTTETKPTNFAADEGTAAAVKPSETLTINGDKTNIATKVEGKAISVKLKDDINVKTVTATDSIGIKNGPTMTTNGIDAANKKITNVAAGTEKTDAVNYGQLKDVESKVDNNTQNITNVNGRVNDLDSRVNKVGAGAAALAALHPLDFDPDDKWDFAVGYGNYRDANSVAVGAFYRPDEDTMFSLGTNFGNGENMINAGVSFKFGQKGKTSNNRLVISKEVTELRSTVARQDEQLKKQDDQLKKQDDQLKKQDNEIKELKAMVNKLLTAQNNKAESAK